MGNYDIYIGLILLVKSWINKKYGGVYYKVDYNNYLCLYGLDIFLIKIISDWLDDKLIILSKNKNVLFFYYDFYVNVWWLLELEKNKLKEE